MGLQLARRMSKDSHSTPTSEARWLKLTCWVGQAMARVRASSWLILIRDVQWLVNWRLPKMQTVIFIFSCVHACRSRTIRDPTFGWLTCVRPIRLVQGLHACGLGWTLRGAECSG